MSEISQLRQNYTQGKLLELEIPCEPIALFKAWFQEAVDAQVPEPNAMTLSTVDQDNAPYARTVLLKNLSEKGFTFFTNYESRKGKHIANNDQVSLLFLWIETERQIHITGKAQKVSAAITRDYFHSRPRASQIGAWTSPQSTVLKNRAELDKLQEEVSIKYANASPIPVPPHWGGYIVEPIQMEFWQGRPSRLHDRLIYSKSANKWKIDRLAP